VPEELQLKKHYQVQKVLSQFRRWYNKVI
jgi:hypothetical protein